MNNNESSTFQMINNDECVSAITKAYCGKFSINDKEVILDFGLTKAYYYLKDPLELLCKNLNDSLTTSERNIVCNKQIIKSCEIAGKVDPNTVYLKKPALFPRKIEGTGKDKNEKRFIVDLKTNCFIISK